MDAELRRYLDEAARQPLLSRAEERELSREAAGGSQEAKDTLVRCNLRLVVAIAKRYRATGVPLLDLIQEGNLGLLRAVERYDPERGFVFSAFATWWIRQALGSFVRDTATAAPPTSDALARVQDAWDAFVVHTGRQPTLAELASETGLSEDDLTELLGRPPESE